MKKNIISFSLILLLSILLLTITSCNKFSSDNSQAPEPSIDIVDMSKESKTEVNNMFVFIDNYTVLNQIFWRGSEKEDFYKGQLKENDVNIAKSLENKPLKSGPLFENHKMSATFSSKALKPTLVLGKLEDDLGHTSTWKQSYTAEDAVINIPEFEGETAKIALRFIWLDDNERCYGVVDTFVSVKKQ
ncbi:hypothetical protein P4V58_14130 [Bacillus wiedmannii]|uniref:hypothetical protein n=1 Tax=Bacillus wiedmannii TaxID=1890302 RepID=UPI002E222741|nr:hypothetical protein [Bacillus wiedmannii]